MRNCERFRKRFLITFFRLLSENEENNRNYHKNSFGHYANGHFRTHDLQLTYKQGIVPLISVVARGRTGTRRADPEKRSADRADWSGGRTGGGLQ